MRFHLITLPLDHKQGQFNTQELDDFCQHHHILDWQFHFFVLHQQVFWTCWLGYEPIAAPDVPQQAPQSQELQLPPLQQQVYEALKKWRRERAYQDGIATYIIAKNLELQRVATEMPQTASHLLAIPGFGKKKVAKYGQDILRIIQTYTHNDLT